MTDEIIAFKGEAMLQRDIDRFHTKYQRGGPNECWPWLSGATKRPGGQWRYGMFWIDGQNIMAHRVSWAIANRASPEGLFVCHTCDNPICVNPNHLFLGTAGDNNKDKARKGRAPRVTGKRHGRHTRPEATARGSKNGTAKLTETDVVCIRRLGAEGMKHREIADRFGVHRSLIGLVLKGKIWSHV